MQTAPPVARRGRELGGSKELVFLRRQDLAALVHAGLQVDVVRALQLAGFLVFDEGVGAQRVVRAAHVAPRGEVLRLGTAIGISLA